MLYTPMLLHLFQLSLIQAKMQVKMQIFVKINYVNTIMYTVVNWVVISAASLMITHDLFLSAVQVIFSLVKNALHIGVFIIQHSWSQENSNGRDF